jgi:hypothetical protein
VVGHDDAIKGRFVGAVAREANVNSHESSENEPEKRDSYGRAGKVAPADAVARGLGHAGLGCGPSRTKTESY